MKVVGLIGGMSWESTQYYYQIMNQYIREKLGGHNSLEMVVYSVNFERILELVHQNKWDSVGDEIGALGKKLELAGANFIMLTSNAAHKVVLQLEKAIHIPILHIVDPTAEAIKKRGMKKIGLLGTKVTMEEPFYKNRLQDLYTIETVIPDREGREVLHQIIFDELTIGKVCESSKKRLLRMIEDLNEKGAEGIILGCTELTLLVGQKETRSPLFDTTALHAYAGVDLACS